GVCGKARHGKGTIGAVLTREYGFTQIDVGDGVRACATALDPIVVPEEGWTYNDVIRMFGYDEAKKLTGVRRLLQRIGTEVGRNVLGENVWVNALDKRVREHLRGQTRERHIVITDVRFHNEADYIRDQGGMLWLVSRPLPTPVDEHESERYAYQLGASRVFVNEADVEDLRVKTRMVMAEYGMPRVEAA